jgi:hypothetical protein
MPRGRDRNSFGAYGSRLEDTIGRLGLGGVMQIGQLNWQSYPIAAAATTITGAAANVDGATATIIAAAAIADPYIITHICQGGGATADFSWRLKLQDTGATVRRIIVGQTQNDEAASDTLPYTRTLLPYRIGAALGVQGILACSVGGPEEIKVYISTLLTQPQMWPSLMKAAPAVNSAIVPTTATGTTIVSSGVPWAWPASYTEITAGIATPILVTSVILRTYDHQDDKQISIASGGSEIDWGIFGVAGIANNTGMNAAYNLMPYPLYVPANTRLAARIRSAGNAATIYVTLEYIPLLA